MLATTEQAKPCRMMVYSRNYGKNEITVKVNRDTLEVICDIGLHQASIEMLQVAVKHGIRDFSITGEEFKFVRFHTVLKPVTKQDDEY